MRVLVLGATGYIGSRLVPTLLEQGHDVVAASSSRPDPNRFAWGHRVSWRQCDVTRASDVAAALRDVDAVCYLVHSLATRGFRARDLSAAQSVRHAISASGVRRLVYLSGLVPDVPDDELSGHLLSRLEVERELLASECSVLALRAGVVIGAGSTSFEVIRQIGSLLLVQPVPLWLRSQIQPVAVTDCVQALVESFEKPWAEGSLDVGGPDIVRYPDLLRRFSGSARLVRVPVPTLFAPTDLVALATAGLVQVPFWTVTSLIESLRHDMVCRPENTWRPRHGGALLTISAAMDRALDPASDTLEQALPSDPEWARTRAPILDELRAPLHLRAATSLGLYRLRRLLGPVSGR